MACKECKGKIGVKRKYRGQTGRSTYDRINEHFENWEKKKEDSPLWKHSVEHHGMNTFPVEVKVLKRCFGQPTRRMITEVVMIEDMNDGEALNNKTEYGYVRIPRINVEL